MDDGEMAMAVAYVLNDEQWTAVGLDIGEVFLTNEDGEKFILSITKVERFPDEDDDDNTSTRTA